jgi:hypothetical protein
VVRKVINEWNKLQGEINKLDSEIVEEILIYKLKFLFGRNDFK